MTKTEKATIRAQEFLRKEEIFQLQKDFNAVEMERDDLRVTNKALIEALKACRQELVNYNCSCNSAIKHIGFQAIHQADTAIHNATK